MAGLAGDPAMKSIRVYSRPGCHLCEQLIEEMLPLVRGKLDIDVVDIDSRDDWRDAYDIRIPVVEFEGRFVCQYTLDPDALEAVIAGIAAPQG